MVNGIRTIYPSWLNKGFGSEFCLGSRVRHKTPEESRRMHRPKRCEFSNEDEDNNTNTRIIIIITSHYQHGYPRLSLATPPYWQVLKVTSRFGTELLYVGSSWSSCLCSSMRRGPQENIPYELFPTSPAVFRRSGSSNFDSFRDG